jgi:subtilisin
MATRKKVSASSAGITADCETDRQLLAALARSDESLQTGRYLITYREGAATEGFAALQAHGLEVADSRDFAEQALSVADVGSADAIAFAECGVALVGGEIAAAQGLTVESGADGAGPIEAVEPETFVFASSDDYLRGFRSAVAAIAGGLGGERAAAGDAAEGADDAEAQVLGATWGLRACGVPTSPHSGVGIRFAILDTGFDLGHPDFVGRTIVSQSFVGQPIQDLNGHAMHCAGTAAGPKAPRGTTPRYGMGHRCKIHVAKVLTNTGSGTTASVLAGMNWAIAKRCQVILVPLGTSLPAQAAYTAAGAAALRNGCLMIAASGSNGGPTGAPANSPTIMAVAALDQNLRPTPFSSRGKIEIAAPGRDIFSAAPRPRLYQTWSGTSAATAHVAGCAVLWAQTSATLRGTALWRQLQASARRLPYPASLVGAGLVRAPR